MTCFMKHLEREGTTPSALIKWIRALKRKGILLKATTLPELVYFGANHDIVSRVVCPGYGETEQLIEELEMAGYRMDCTPLIRRQKPLGGTKIYARELDSTSILERLRAEGVCDPKKGHFEEAADYLSYLRLGGICASGGEWEDVLPKEHHDLILVPSVNLELHVIGGRDVRRCVPGWSNAHPNTPRYYLGKKWTQDSDLVAKVNNYHDKKLFKFTDGICEDCSDV